MKRIPTTSWLTVAFVLQAMACSGEASSPSGSNDPMAPGVGAGGGMMVGPPGSGGNTSTPPEIGPPGTPEGVPGTTAGRRLNKEEYVNSIVDVFGAPGTEAAGKVAGESAAAFTFRNHLSSLAVSDQRISDYELIAGEIAAALEPNAFLKYAGGCVDNTPACRDAFIAELGRHVYRRPLSPAEVANLAPLFDVVASTPEPFVQGARLVVRAMLQSPHFLYRLERKQARPDNYEMASRLSYLLWKSGPDTTLLDAASRGELSTPEGLDLAAQRMLSDAAKTKRGVRAFADDWLRVYTNLTRGQVQDYSPGVFSAMREETLRFFERLLVEEQAPLSELLTNRESEFSEELAGIYGVQPNPSGKYDLSTEPNRTGLLTQLAVLGTRAGPMRASLVDRGLTIAEEFLCIHIPPPPAAAQDAVANFGKTLPPDASEREKLAAHSSAGECVGCHSMIDPFGLPFENFDLIGKYSQTDEHGNMLQGNGELTLDGQKRTYANVAEFSAIVAASKQAQDCMAEKYVQYALARQLESGETALVEHAIATSQMKGGTYAAWVSAVVSSKSFGNPAPEVLAQ